MKNEKVLFVTEKEVLRHCTMDEAHRLVRASFRELKNTRLVRMPPKIYLNLPHGDFRAMPVYSRLGGAFAGVKWICVFPHNPRRGLPSVMGTLLLNDATTGRLCAVFEANAITALRTGAAGAVASEYLASRPRVLALVGAGVQAEYQLRSHTALFRFSEVRVWSRYESEGRKFVRRFGRRSGNLRYEPDLGKCVRGADIICTCTPSRKPLVKAEWIKPGAHINAIGADAPGKRELETKLLKMSRIFVDDVEQASYSGEINVPFSRHEIRHRDIDGTLTDVLAAKCGRKSPADITVFDSTGLAIQDIVLAELLYKKMSR